MTSDSFETILLVGSFPMPDILAPLTALPKTAVIFYGEGVNTPWNGESHFFYLMTDVTGRGRSPFSQCLTDSECVRRLLSAGKVLTF